LEREKIGEEPPRALKKICTVSKSKLSLINQLYFEEINRKYLLFKINILSLTAKQKYLKYAETRWAIDAAT
jgi:hypothetical protein